MKEPRRLLSETDTSPLAHSMLAAGRARRERDGARQRVWGAVGVAVAGGAALAATSASASAGAGAGAGAGAAKSVGVAVALTKVKVIVAAVLIATTAAAGAAYVTHEQGRDNADRGLTSPLSPAVQTARISSALPPSERSSERAPVNPDVLPVASAEATTFIHTQSEAQPDTQPTQPTQPTQLTQPRAAHARAESKPRPTVDAAKNVSVSELREEAGMLGDVRSALAAGDGGTAAARLDEARARFPRTRLGQERDALEIRVAIANGDRARASTLARAFVTRYPDSPFRPGIEASIGE